MDENNQLYLTLPKLKDKFKKKGVENGPNYAKTETNESTNRISPKPSPNIFNDDENEDNLLDENIKEILYENENDNKTRREKEEKGKILFDKLKTRYNNFGVGDGKKNSKSLPKHQKQVPSEYKLIATPKQISEFDYNLGKSFVNGKLRYLTKSQKEKLAYIAELNLFNSMNRLKEKNNLIKGFKKNNSNRKKNLMPIHFFKYDKKKWKQFYDQKNRNINTEDISKLNDENKEKLDVMKEHINILNADAIAADADINKAVSNINAFLGKYGVDNISRRESFSSLKSMKTQNLQNSRKKEKKDNEEIKEKKNN